MNKQQEQTYRYFNDNVKAWQHQADVETYSLTKNRIAAVECTLAKIPNAKNVIDLASGTGDLCISLAQQGYDTLGVDFAPNMIIRAKENNDRAGTDAEFICASVFDIEPEDRFDLCSIQGLIDYISMEQLDTLLEKANHLLNPGGYLDISALNRLFNLYSLDSFTHMECELDMLQHLLDEAMLVGQAKNADELFEKLRQRDFEYVHPSTHPRLYESIDIDTRFQYTPGDLLKRIEKHGFEVTAIYNIQYHGLPANMRDCCPDWFRTEARYVQDHFIDCVQLLPRCLGYVMEARKNEGCEG